MLHILKVSKITSSELSSLYKKRMTTQKKKTLQSLLVLREKILVQLVEILKLFYVKILHPHRQPWHIPHAVLAELPHHTIGYLSL